MYICLAVWHRHGKDKVLFAASCCKYNNSDPGAVHACYMTYVRGMCSPEERLLMGLVCFVICRQCLIPTEKQGNRSLNVKYRHITDVTEF
jgi:hypothetical protein